MFTFRIFIKQVFHIIFYIYIYICTYHTRLFTYRCTKSGNKDSDKKRLDFNGSHTLLCFVDQASLSGEDVLGLSLGGLVLSCRLRTGDSNIFLNHTKNCDVNTKV